MFRVGPLMENPALLASPYPGPVSDNLKMVDGKLVPSPPYGPGYNQYLLVGFPEILVALDTLLMDFFLNVANDICFVFLYTITCVFF